MPISFTNYIDITSAIGGNTLVPQRNLTARLFTDNPLLPTDSMMDFTNATSVGAYFGTTSEEYARAFFYFNWISKAVTTPQLITFARWTDADVAPQIYGNIQTQLLSTYTSITSGSFSMTIGGVTNNFTGIDFSAASSLANVASILQTEIRTGTGTQWTAATVTYDATRGSFDFMGGDAVVATISIAEGTAGTPIATIIGWLSGAIFSNGKLTETITDILTSSTAISNNFGSFLFMPTFILDQIIEAATWNSTQTEWFLYSTVLTDITQASAYNAALNGLQGTAVTYSITDGEYPEEAPMMIMAATNYNVVNSVQNYEFQIFNLTPSVTDDATSATLNNYKINYYGQTQTAGVQINFYQQGVLMGGITEPQDINVLANEAWFKDAIGSSLMNLLLVLNQVSANQQGRTQILVILQNSINQALSNGTISVGKPLTITQQLYIQQITGSATAWYQVQNIGYWVDCQIVPYVVDSVTKYKANYTLIYSKDDVIRLIEGTDILI